ncbi:hypothetical protein HXQ33_002599 [Salmonella enterica]|nr:hypothetical protein [Salmonella enterica]EGA8154528.1 hypothetical protein [Salmonella enterica]EGJ9091492.1 hypothetical protein [Salmonella enterica]EGN1293894.1 hypothetical protein [Salmonella enterica]EGT8525247.1 hypothetical protein [Salmonella enterica]
MEHKNEVFPAPAGINRRAKKACSPLRRVPRASGDKPVRVGNDQRIGQCSPRQRG